MPLTGAVWETAGAILLSLGGGVAVILAFSSWLGKVWASRILEADRARFERELDSYRSVLATVQEEHRVRFSTRHQRQIQVIAGSYGRLDRLHRALRALASKRSIDHDVEGYREAARQAYSGFIEFYYTRAIWLDESTVEAMNAVLDQLNEAAAILLFSSDATFDNVNAKLAVLKLLDQQVPVTRNRLNTRLRELIGFGDESAAASPIQSQPRTV